MKEPEAKPPKRSQLVREFQRGKLLGTLFGKHSRAWGRDEKIVAAISDAHNDGAIDVLSILTDDAIEALKGHVFFQGQTLYCSLIPKLNDTAEGLVRAVQVLIRGAGNDGAAGLPASALAEWCEKDPSRPHDMLALVDDGMDGASSFLTLTLRVGTQTDREYFLDRTHEFAINGETVEQCAAIRALGQIQPQTEDEWKRLISTLGRVAALGDDSLGAVIIEAVTQRLCADDCPRRSELEGVSEATLQATHGENTLHQSADALWLHGKHISSQLRTKILGALLDLKPQNVGTISHLDQALAELVKNGEAQEASAFLEKLVLQNVGAIKLDQFSSTCRALHADKDHALEDWLVDWFLKGDFDLCKGLSSAFFGVEVDDLILTVDFNRYGLSAACYPYLARKVIGFMFLKPITAASIIVSLVRSAPDEVVAQLEDLLFDPMLLNYSGVERKLLLPVSADRKDKARKTVKRARDRVARYLADLAAAQNIKELHPSERQRQIERQRSADMMANAQREANQGDSFLNLITKVIVLHGHRTISYHQTRNEEPRRIDSKMATLSYSYEMPRVEVVDPAGLQRMLLSFRLERPPT